MGVVIQNRCTAQLLYQRDADQAQTPANTSSRNCMSCPGASEPISAAKLQARARGIACHAPELASPCSEDTCDCYPLGLRPRRQHSMPRHNVARSARGSYQESSFSSRRWALLSQLAWQSGLSLQASLRASKHISAVMHVMHKSKLAYLSCHSSSS